MSKRTLEAFFKPFTPDKRPKTESELTDTGPPSEHPNYPIPIPALPSHIAVSLTHGTPARNPRPINNQPHLDLLYFQPYITRTSANELFKFLRRELPFYRVQYQIRRNGVETQINTPRFTTVFGVDETAKFVRAEDHEPTSPTSGLRLANAKTDASIPPSKYQYPPRPIPECLDHLRRRVQEATGAEYNFCLVNYYASGDDSIAFHSDDERFLGSEPNIASLSLGGEREFLMKHKPEPGQETPEKQQGILGKPASTSTANGVQNAAGYTASGVQGPDSRDSNATLSPSQPAVAQPSPRLKLESGSQLNTTSNAQTQFPLQPQPQKKAAHVHGTPIKLALSSGDMVVMQGPTQSHWLHSIPKRKGKGESVRGRINITFRKAVVPAGTNNYYHYNVGAGGVYRWDEVVQEMVLRK